MKINGEAIYSTQKSPLPKFDWGRCTQKQSKHQTILYLSVFNWPKDGKLFIPGIENKILGATILSNGEKCNTKQILNGIELSLPSEMPNNNVSVIKLVVKGKLLSNQQSTGKMKSGALDE
jgi:alpha-L-fucosidase